MGFLGSRLGHGYWHAGGLLGSAFGNSCIGVREARLGTARGWTWMWLQLRPQPKLLQSLVLGRLLRCVLNGVKGILYSPYQQPLYWGCPQEGAENWVSAFMRAFTLKGRTKQWVPTSTMYPNNREHKVSYVDSCLTHNIAQRKWHKIWTLLKREALKIFQFCFIHNRGSENY